MNTLKKNKMLIIVLLVVLTASASAGDPERISTSRPIFIQAMPFSGAQSLGFSGMTSSPASAISGANPAALARFTTLTAGIEYQEMSTIGISNYIDIKLSKVQPWAPSGFGLVYPLEELRIALGYRLAYSALVDYGKIEISTIEQPDGTGEYIHAVSKLAVHQASAMLSYAFNDIALSGDMLSVGGQLDWGFLSLNEKIYHATAKADDREWSWKVGALYSLSDLASLAFSFASGFNYRYNIETNGVFLTEDSNAVAPKLEEQFGFPSRAGLGLSLQPLESLRFALSAEYIFWQEVRNEFDNQLDVSAKTLLRLNYLVTVSAGGYAQNFSNNITKTDNSSVFLGGGLRISAKPFTVFLEVYGNHLSAQQKYQKQFVGRMGMEFAFFDY